MQRVRFGLALDGERGWHARNALGDSTVGPLGMLSLLEMHLGLSRKARSACERVVQFRECLRRSATGGRFYEQSFEADSLGTTATLLAWRDLWHEHGWRGAGPMDGFRRISVVSPSWGGPALFPATYRAGLNTLRSLGLVVREYPSTRVANASVEYRVRDIHTAFADKDVRAIIASIGGEDSVRLLPKLDSQLLSKNPKIVLGYSDTCTLLVYLRSLGHVAFHGPSVMAGHNRGTAPVRPAD